MTLGAFTLRALTLVVLSTGLRLVRPLCVFCLSDVFKGVPFTNNQVTLMYSYFLANINIEGKGGVVASPDRMVPGGGSYYYHWARDGALSMRALQEVSPHNVT